MFLSLKLAVRFVFSVKKESFSSYASWLAIGGLAIGICALMLTASIIQGFQQVISEKLSSFEGQGRVQHLLGKPVDFRDNMIDSLFLNNSHLIAPYVRGVCMIRAGGNAEGALIEGVRYLPQSISTYDSIPIFSGQIIIGQGLADELDVGKGEHIFIQIFSSNNNFSSLYRIKSMKIRDIYYSGLQEYDKTLAYTNIDDARELFGLSNDQVTGLIINTQDMNSFSDQIKYPYYIETWQERHALLFEWIKIQRLPAYIMFGLIALVGLVNLIAAITMIILEKSSQIGVLLAQGTQVKVLKQIFMIQGGFIGLMGGGIGGVLSITIILIQKKFEVLVIPSDIYFMDQIPFSFDLASFGVILFITLLLSIISSWWPTKTLTQINAAKTLRYE